jgi:hypothetical protein
MPDRLTRARPAWVDFALIVGMFAVAGVLGALIWEWVWTAPYGLVYDHQWTAEDEGALQGQFYGTGWYVVIATVGGLVVGALAALFVDRRPLLTLAAVVVGSALATFLMIRIGAALGPADPHTLAKHATDATRLPEDLTVSEWSPWIAFPAGALVAVLLVFVGLSPRRHVPAEDVAAG